ncbi:MAG: YbaB/EbfC family nucleoid-associated protein [Planctomycetota bacterium]
MFDQFKAMGAIAGLMRDKERLAELAEEFKGRLDGMSVTGAAGGGAVRVTVSGKLRVTEVQIDPAMATGLAHDRVAGEALITEATNDALERAQRMVAEQARLFAEEHGLGDLPGMDRIGGLLGSG